MDINYLSIIDLEIQNKGDGKINTIYRFYRIMPI